MNREPLLGKPLGQMLGGQGRPQQRGHWIPRSHPVQQPEQRLLDAGLALGDPLSSTARATNPTRGNLISLPNLRKAPADCGLRDPRRAHDSRHTTTPVRASLRRRPSPPTTLIQRILDDQPPLTDPRLIDHHCRHDGHSYAPPRQNPPRYRQLFRSYAEARLRQVASETREYIAADWATSNLASVIQLAGGSGWASQAGQHREHAMRFSPSGYCAPAAPRWGCSQPVGRRREWG